MFKLHNFISHAGVLLDWKIECDNLTDEDLKCLAVLIQDMTGSYCFVQGIPTGGLRIAEALREYQTQSPSDPYLIVDDVFTTGRSMAYARWQSTFFQSGHRVIGAVIFSRGWCPEWVKPLFQLNMNE